MNARSSLRISFENYKKLISERKRFLSRGRLIEKANHTGQLTASLPIKHPSINEEIQVVVDLSSNRRSNFGFQIRADFACPQPLFRFDSEGPSHRNKAPGVPIYEQRITTPHFHRFDENGDFIAYKTPQLKEPNQCSAICGDYQFGFAHFCIEANITSADDSIPTLDEDTLTLFQNTEPDPLAGIAFQ